MKQLLTSQRRAVAASGLGNGTGNNVVIDTYIEYKS